MNRCPICCSILVNGKCSHCGYKVKMKNQYMIEHEKERKSDRDEQAKNYNTDSSGFNLKNFFKLNKDSEIQGNVYKTHPYSNKKLENLNTIDRKNIILGVVLVIVIIIFTVF